MQRKRILFVHGITDMAGGEFFLLDLVKHLSSDRYEPIVLLPGEGELTRRFRSNGVTVYILPFMGRNLLTKGLAFLFTLPRLAVLLRQKQIDLIHANDLKPAILAGLAAKLFSIPVIWTVHNSVYETRSKLRKMLIQYGVDRIVSVSKYTQAQFSGYAPSRLSIVHIGIDTQRFQKHVESTARDELLTITAIGRFDPIKDLETAIAAATILIRQNELVRFLFVCSDFHTQASSYRTTILGLIEENQVSDRIAVVPFSDRIEDVYQKTDILISTSLSESLGLTLLEAMACQIPVVATRCGGPEETVIDGETGFLIPIRDPGSLVRALADLVSDPQLRRDMGRQGRSRVLSHFSHSGMIDAYCTLYDSMTS